jgi:superfamily II DNA or RNA helicase
LNKVFQEIVFDTPLLTGIREGWLVDIKGYRVKTQVSLDDVHVTAGELNQAELEKAINIQSRNEQIVLAWLELASTRQTVVFTNGIQHAKDLADVFKRYGIAAEAVWGNDPHRREKLEWHRKGKLQALLNDSLLTEGYDDWQVSCIVDASPTISTSRYEQKIGRGTRLDPETGNLIEAKAKGKTPRKTDLLVIDVVDNSKRHTLNNVSTLFGLAARLDTKGKPRSEVVQALDEAEKKAPSVDLDRLEDITKLESFIEEVNLFKVTFPEEVLANSSYQWHRTRNGSYVLLLADKGERVVLKPDMLDNWTIEGMVRGSSFVRKVRDFVTAITAYSGEGERRSGIKVNAIPG